MTGSKIYSPFAAMIRRMLDESGLCTWDQWAALLGLQRAALDAWVTDDTLPSPRDFRLLMRTLTTCTGVPSRLLADLRAFLDRRMDEVTPLHEQRGNPLLVGWTVRQYAEAPVLVGLLRALHTKPIGTRAAVIDAMRSIIHPDAEHTSP